MRYIIYLLYKIKGWDVYGKRNTNYEALTTSATKTKGNAG